MENQDRSLPDVALPDGYGRQAGRTDERCYYDDCIDLVVIVCGQATKQPLKCIGNSSAIGKHQREQNIFLVGEKNQRGKTSGL